MVIYSKEFKEEAICLSDKIQAILNEHPDNDNYGVKRMNAALKQKGINGSPRTLYCAMFEIGLLHRKRFHAAQQRLQRRYKITKI